MFAFFDLTPSTMYNSLQFSYKNLYYLFIGSLLCVLLKVLCVWIIDLRKRLRYANKIPQLRVMPIISYIPIFIGCVKTRKDAPPYVYYIFQFLCGYCHIFAKEKLVIFWLWLRPLIMLFKPEAVEVILSNSSVLEKANEYYFLKPWLGEGLLISSGNKWRHRRKLLTYSFHFRILEDFLPVYNEQSQIFIHKIKNMNKEKPINITPLVTACTLDIICETTMGLRVNAQLDTEHEYVKAIKEVGDLFITRLIRPWLWADWIYNLTSSGQKFRKKLQVLHEFTRKVIKEKKIVLQSQASRIHVDDKQTVLPDNIYKRNRKALLELLLENNLEHSILLSDEDIREEVDTFMFEGHDTTNIGICWALYNIGLYPQIQEKIKTELDEIFEGDKERFVNIEDLKSMKYLERVLKESLRLYPSVPYIGREVTEDIDICGYKIVAGSACMIFTFMMHRDPKIYPNPEVFDPDRFLPEKVAERHPYAYIPFSAGPRNCIGQKFAMMEEKVVTANILRNFTIKSVNPKDKVLFTSEIVLRTITPLNIQFIPR